MNVRVPGVKATWLMLAMMLPLQAMANLDTVNVQDGPITVNVETTFNANVEFRSSFNWISTQWFVDGVEQACASTPQPDQGPTGSGSPLPTVMVPITLPVTPVLTTPGTYTIRVVQHDNATCTSAKIDSTLPPAEDTLIVQNQATVTLTKDFTDDDPNAQAQVSLQCTDGTVSVMDPTTLNDAGSVQFTVTGWNPANPPNCTASENDLSALGYFQSAFSGECDSTGVIAGITSGSESACTLANSPTVAAFTVTKSFDDKNPQAASVTLACKPGPQRMNIATNPADASTAQGAMFTVSYFDPTSTDCTATEAPLLGYTQDMQASTCGQPVALGDPSGGTFSCAIFNQQDPVEVVVTKSYTVAHPVADPEVELTLFCNAGTVSNTDPTMQPEGPVGGVVVLPSATKTTSGGTASFWVSDFPYDGTGCWAEETVPAGYVQSDSTCGDSQAPGISVSPGADIPDPPTCNIENRPTEAVLTVDKNFSDANPQLQVMVTPACMDAGGGPGITFTPASGTAQQAVDFVTTVQYFAGATSCTASEVDPVGYTQDLAQSTCDDGVAVADDVDNSCVIFNQQDPVSIVASKVYAGGGGPAATFAAACTGGSVQVAPASQPVAGGGSGEFIVSNFPWDGANCSITEPTAPAGFHEVSSTCNDLSIVPSDADTLCAITNAETLANVRVTKDFTDGQNPTEVTVALDCNGGLIVDQDKVITEGDANFVNFVVKNFIDGELDCTVVEDTDALPGYITSYAASVISQQAGDQVGFENDDEGCHFTGVTGGAELSCVVTNDAAPQDIVITKLWQFEGSVTPSDIDTGYELTLHCDGPVIADGSSSCGPERGGDTIVGDDSAELYWCKRFAGDFDSSGTFTATVIPQYPGNGCYVEEKTDSNFIEVNNGCDDLEVVSGTEGGDSCTITNLVFFEGIPTLSQYGMAILALLMLGVGLVGFRRFA